MPSIAQQDYKIIAPKEGRGFNNDAAALGELKKSILNGIGFDCIIKDTVAYDGDFNRVLGFYPNGNTADVWSFGNSEVLTINMKYTVAQYEGLAAVQEQMDEASGLMSIVPSLTVNGDKLQEDSEGYYICVDNKYLIVTGDETVTALTIAETGPTEHFVNITWEDAQKLIGLPLA